MWRRLMFQLAYRRGRPRWDTGRTPPELIALVERLPTGRALDLGCGTGTNAVYLAQHGWEALGIDFVGKSIEAAKRRALDAGVTERCAFEVSDVTRLERHEGPFDLAVDIGCYHSIDEPGRRRVAAGLARLVRSGGIFFLYAFAPGPDGTGRFALGQETIVAELGAAFHLLEVDRGMSFDHPSAYYTFERTPR
ncbi:MAG: class I SAM-dependent methyltransferase [Candidatus Limnocylindria bacterium]